uniref:Integrase n=1 Tax=Cajanus cajan TaxID=3821 RepID=A0A151REI7_CAJCA|nr:hypothetical protein KK1_037733 [Cajanus cajan]
MNERKWNQDLLSIFFGTEDIRDIFSIPLLNLHEHDTPSWKLSRKGSYSVKSAYYYVKESLISEKEITGKKGWLGILRFNDRICVPNDSEIKKIILGEAHKSKLSIHPRATKMYQDLKKNEDTGDATWELEEKIRKKLSLFILSNKNFEDKNFCK